MGNYFLKKRLRKANLDNTPKFNFANQTRYCKVIKIYDGDTITVAMEIHKKIYKYSLRMLGYDSPEMKPPKNQPNRDDEIKAAKEAKQVLMDKIGNKIVRIELEDFDKYGRLLGTVYLQSGYLCCGITENINKYMIDNNYGYPYEGGTKKKFEIGQKNN